MDQTRGMGITDEVAKKSVFGKTGAEAVEKMVKGEADIAISFVSEIMPIKGAARRLASADLRASVRAGCVRLSFHLYNDESDVDHVLDALSDLRLAV